ncbi:hypothetical protein [Fibrobacter sp. UWH4]|uniref:hypothetical protein n=1 Tax=Fibrobacter sp. UWH4 TaxID=1896210 RepID=UPI00091DC93B|nr:hypothetical protein [Fibrobacter sp. UWH4]SHL10593.1 hypothetical protein SAMN05720762_104204 [Fibrobacter sp. UWH4]
MKSNQILGIASLLTLGVLPFLAACSSDESSTSSPHIPEFSAISSSSAKKTSVKTTFELGSCTYENMDERIYVSNENDYYTCTYSYTSYDYTWVGEKVKSSSSITVSSSSSDICDVFYCWDETESSSSIKSSSSTKSSSSVSTFTNVSDVWNGKMVKPSTDYIDGKTYMLIYTAEELAYFADQVTNKGEEKLNAKLMKHIRLNPDNMVDEKGNLLISQSKLNEWTPIGGGTNNVIFKGIFDGNGYTISGIYVNKPAFERAGFIGTLGGTSTSDSGHVMFLGIENSYIVGGEQVGGIVGRMNYSEVQQVFNRKSYVKGTKYAGGIVGYKNNGWLYYSYNSGMVVSSEDRASGIAGYNANASTSVIVSYNVGFLIAPNKGTTAGISTTANSSKDCFYIDQDDREIVANGAAEKTEYFLSSEEFVSTLNGLSFSNIWTTDDDEVNDDYPVFKWEKIRY